MAQHRRKVAKNRYLRVRIAKRKIALTNDGNTFVKSTKARKWPVCRAFAEAQFFHRKIGVSVNNFFGANNSKAYTFVPSFKTDEHYITYQALHLSRLSQHGDAGGMF